MTEEWEYYEEAIAIQAEKNWLNSCPVICHTCRWFDSYYRAGCTQLAYPDAQDRCILYAYHANYKRFNWFGKDFHYRLWQVKVWFFEKVLRQKANYIGSWRQWEYEDNPEWVDDEDDW